MLRYVQTSGRTYVSTSPLMHTVFLDLNYHPFREPFKNCRVCKHSRNLDLTSVNTTGLGPPVSIFLECAGFEDSYRRIAQIEFVAFVGLQLVFDNGEGIGRVPS